MWAGPTRTSREDADRATVSWKSNFAYKIKYHKINLGLKSTRQLTNIILSAATCCLKLVYKP